MNDIGDSSLRNSLNFYRSYSQLDPKILGATQIPGHFLDPVAAFPIHPSFLANRQRCQRDHDCNGAGEFDCVLQ